MSFVRRSPTKQNTQPRGLVRALVLLLACSLPAFAQNPAPISIAEVNRILQTPAESIVRRVSVRGVVTHASENPRTVFLQADNAGVMGKLAADIPLPELGDELEVEADVKFTNPRPDTQIDAATARVIGHPGLPELARCTIAEALAGKFNRLAVETEALVLHSSRHFGVPWVMLSDATGVAMAGVYSSPPGWDPTTLVGRRVRFRGIAAGVWHMSLRCSSPDEITALGPGAGGDALEPLKSASAVLTFTSPDGKPHPVVFRGTCTYVSPSRRYCYLRDGQADVLVNLPRTDPGGKIPQPGEDAEISGVTASSGARPQVNAWSVQTLGPAPTPVPARGAEEFTGPFQSMRELKSAPLSLERMCGKGVVIYAARSGAFSVMAVQDPSGTAYFYGPDAPPFQPLPQPGDRVEVEGEHRTAHQFYEAVWRVGGHEKLPPAKRLTVAEAMDVAYDGRRARIRGRVIDYETFVERGMNVSRLWVRDGDAVTYGNYIGSAFAPAPAKIGQLVELDGVCNVGRIAPNVVRSFFVQLNAMTDAHAIAEPFPWQDPFARRISAAIMLALGAAGVWVLVLRRQVRARTARLVTSEAELREALEREQELGQLKTAFVSMVSHEFRTPLNVIATSTDILARYLDRLQPEERIEHFESIQSSVKRMSAMMEDVLLLGRLEAGRHKFHPEELHLPAWCRRFVDEMKSATAGRCPIELSIGEFDPIIRADENVLRHVLANLVSNAVKYSKPGQPVRLSVTRDRDDAVFTVEDHGIGIPESDRELLFEAFRRGRNVGNIGGAGLGLVVVKRGAELHGGTVEFTSAEGSGTVFTVRLPLFNMTTTRPSK